jgi:CHAT domain-containing protein/tetratricopeptide (TPR) repeat protein
MLRSAIHVRRCIILFGILSLFASSPAVADALQDAREHTINAVKAGRYEEAGTSSEKVLALVAQQSGKESFSYAMSEITHAKVLVVLGRPKEAVPLYQHALTFVEGALSADDPAVTNITLDFAELYIAQRRPRDALPLLERTLSAQAKRNDPERYSTLVALARVRELEGEAAEAEKLLRQALHISESAAGPNTIASANILQALSGLLDGRRAFDEAEHLYLKELAIRKRYLGSDHPDVATTLSHLAVHYDERGQSDNAINTLKEALAIEERVLGKDDAQLVKPLSNLAQMLVFGEKPEDGIPYMERSLAIREKVFGRDQPITGEGHAILASLYYHRDNWTSAFSHFVSAAQIAAQNNPNVALAKLRPDPGERRSPSDSSSVVFKGLFGSAAAMAKSQVVTMLPSLRGAIADKTFIAAQWATQSSTASALAQMAARQAKGNSRLAGLARERQDLVQELAGVDNEIVALAFRTKHIAGLEQSFAGAIRRRLSEIDAVMTAEFPEYAALTSPQPLTTAEVGEIVKPTEALVQFVFTDVDAYIWVITSRSWYWSGLERDGKQILADVLALRCGLDVTAWEGAGRQKCRDLTMAEPVRNRDGDIVVATLPFDYARSYRLYKTLFGNVEDLIEGKHLLIAPSGPLSQLPFQVLVTEPSASEGQRTAAWLIRKHALTVLPAVSSLKALRRVARPSAATRPIAGFGNPLLDGDPGDPFDGQRAQRARDYKSCPTTAPKLVASLSNPRRGVERFVVRGGLADLASVREQTPLPETADELCAVARDLHAESGDVRLGARATEREVKRLSESGELAQYRVLHFATHGALAGEITGTSEPGLLLTPPGTPSEEDDGYLTASEIAGLKLDADWVVLSACNTAAGGTQGAESLSGLARAFIYAQARALLVSHWEVGSDAAVKLITGAMRRLAADKNLGRAEAMRQSMLAMIDRGKPEEAHPALWAPFVVVGEGGR